MMKEIPTPSKICKIVVTCYKLTDSYKDFKILTSNVNSNSKQTSDLYFSLQISFVL